MAEGDNSCHAYMWGTTTCPPGTAPCGPVSCQVSVWSGWGACSEACGGGERERTRTVTVAPSNGGAKCPPLSELDVHCNEEPCTGSCSDCNGGTSGSCRHDLDGTCLAYATQDGGLNVCPSGSSECLPVACEVGAWSKWGKCSAFCGGGSQTRTRSVTTPPTNGGAVCPALEEDRGCNEHSCDDCTGCAGESYGPCRHNANRVCHDYYANTTACPAGTTPCATLAGGTFGLLGDAAGAPGDGLCRSCFASSSGACRHDNDGDTSCFEYVAGTKDCPVGSHPCLPVSCAVGEWSAWSKCSAECGGGSQVRSRAVTVLPTDGGSKCPEVDQEAKCNTEACKAECTACVGKVEGPCQSTKDGTCGAMQGGVCPSDTMQCAVAEDCLLSDWSDWSDCDAVCDGGTQTRSRTVVKPAVNGGKACGALTDSKACNTDKCEWCSSCVGGSAGPCQNTANSVCYGYYEGTTTCPSGSSACVNDGSSLQEVVVAGAVAGDGLCGGCFGSSHGPCRHDADTSCHGYFPGTTTCPPGTHPCPPVACVVSAWTAWTACDANCGGGVTTRSRAVLVAPQNGGVACPDLAQTEACNTLACGPSCDSCAGESSGPCAHADGTCHGFSDGACPAGTTLCSRVDCQVSEWGVWGACDAACGGGLQQRSRTVVTAPANGGKACPALTVSQACNTHACHGCAGCLGGSEGPCMQTNAPVCYGYYEGTSSCPAGTTPCATTGTTLGLLGGAPGDGMCSGYFGQSGGPCQNANNTVCYGFMEGSYTCPPGTAACTPGSCVVSSWGEWGACSAYCGGGTQTRSRSVAQQPTNGGAGCPTLSDSRACNDNKCGADTVESGKCGACAGLSAGPCRHTHDNVCHDYYAGTSTCPSGSSPCVLCDACSLDTSGPCRHDNDGSCHHYQVGKVCPAGTHDCGAGTGGGGGGGGGDGLCSGCWPGTAGPCQQSNTVCHAFFPGTASCPGGTYECSKAGSLPPKPLVVFDIQVEGAFSVEDFAASVARAAGVATEAVVVEVATPAGAGITNVGFVVVSDDPLATGIAVTQALEANMVSAGYTGMNKPLEVSVSTGALTAQSGSGLSSAAVALIAAGAAAAITAVVALAVVARRGAGGLLSRSSSEVLHVNIASPTSSMARVSPVRAAPVRGMTGARHGGMVGTFSGVVEEQE